MATVENMHATFEAGGTIVAGDRVKLSAAARTVEQSGATDPSIGVALQAAASGEFLTVRLFNAGGIVELTAAGAFAVGAMLYGAASGQVDDSSNAGLDRFEALAAATAAGDKVPCLPVWVGGS